MSGSMIEFFADADDLALLFKEFDEAGDFVFVSALSQVNQENVRLKSALEMLNHLVTYDSPVQTGLFLIALPSTQLVKTEIKMQDGSGLKTAFRQMFNKDAIEILLGGEAAATTIVHTTIRTSGETPTARDLFKKLKNVVAKNCIRVGGHYYVAPHAMEKLDRGWRLAPGIEFSPEMNLRRP